MLILCPPLFYILCLFQSQNHYVVYLKVEKVDFFKPAFNEYLICCSKYQKQLA